MSALASRRMRCSLVTQAHDGSKDGGDDDHHQDDDKISRELSKLDISHGNNCEMMDKVDEEEDNLVCDINIQDSSQTQGNNFLTKESDNSRRHGAETAPAYGIVSESESLKRYTFISISFEESNISVYMYSFMHMLIMYI